jgi:CBS-domain-containing membrane protein
MTMAVVAISPDATVPEVTRRMHATNVKRLPVVDERGRLVGIRGLEVPTVERRTAHVHCAGDRQTGAVRREGAPQWPPVGRPSWW